jgi:outer membrane lipoprotein carrier protein
MTRHRILYLVLISWLLPATAVSQQDSRAETYLEAVSGQFSLEEGYRIEMDYVREDIMRETYSEGEGTIWMKGSNYKMVVDEYIVYFDGEKLYSQNTEAEEVYVSVPDPGEAGFFYAVPIRIIKSYQQEFKYQYMGEKPFQGKDRVEIQLYPREPSGPYSLLKLFIHPETLRLEGVQLKHKEGIQYTMTLKKVEGDQDLDASLFAFDPSEYPETEVIELVE